MTLRQFVIDQHGKVLHGLDQFSTAARILWQIDRAAGLRGAHGNKPKRQKKARYVPGQGSITPHDIGVEKIGGVEYARQSNGALRRLSPAYRGKSMRRQVIRNRRAVKAALGALLEREAA